MVLSALAPRAGGAGAASVLVCIPTLARRGGQTFLQQVMAAVRSERREGLQIQIMLMHENGGPAPPGADVYVPRPEPNVSAPCSFLLWRRRLLADFMHLMREALLRTSPDDVDHIMWLEDDALLAAGWAAAVLDGSAATSCMTALHKCNCHSCDGAGNYNGVGMVASLFHRRPLEALLQQMATMHPSPFSGVRALDTLVYELCKARPDRGPAVFRLPPAAVHLGDIVVTSTKPVPDARVNITWPAPGDVVPRPLVGRKPLVVLFTHTGLVYDAEYTWTINLSTNYEQLVYPKASYKVASPLSEELCTDALEWTLKFEIQGLTMPWGAHEDLVIGIDVFEEESEDATRVATGLRTVTVMDQSHVGPYQVHPDEITTSLFFRAPACTAGETAEFVTRVHGLAHGVRYGLLVMVLSGENKMHVNESVLEVLEESAEVDAKESYSRYLSLQLPELPAGDYTIRLSVLDMFQLWIEDFERGPQERGKHLLDAGRGDRTRELMVSTMVQNLHVQEAVTRSASPRVGMEPEEGLGQDAAEQFNQEGLVQDTMEQVDEDEELGQDAMKQVVKDAQAEWQAEWAERIEEEGGGVRRFEEAQIPEEPSRSDSASSTGVCSSDAAAASSPSSPPSAPSSTLSSSSSSTSASDTTIDEGRSRVSDDEEWVVKATR